MWIHQGVKRRDVLAHFATYVYTEEAFRCLESLRFPSVYQMVFWIYAGKVVDVFQNAVNEDNNLVDVLLQSSYDRSKNGLIEVLPETIKSAHGRAEVRAKT